MDITKGFHFFPFFSFFPNHFLSESLPWANTTHMTQPIFEFEKFGKKIGKMLKNRKNFEKYRGHFETIMKE